MAATLREPGSGGSGARDVIFSRDGDAVLGDSGHRWYAAVDVNVTGVLLSAGTAPGGADLVVDVLLDGASSLFTVSPKPTIVDGANEGSTGAPDVTLVPAGHYLAVVILAVGDSPPGAKVDVRIQYE